MRHFCKNDKIRFRQENVDSWVRIFASSDLPHGPVNDMQAVFEDEQVKHSSVVQTIRYENSNSEIKVPGTERERERQRVKVLSNDEFETKLLVFL